MFRGMVFIGPPCGSVFGLLCGHVFHMLSACTVVPSALTGHVFRVLSACTVVPSALKVVFPARGVSSTTCAPTTVKCAVLTL